MPDSIEDKLKRAEQLRNDFKFAESLDLIEKIEEIIDLPEENRLSCIIMKAYILGSENKRAEATELAKKAYNLSQKLNNEEGIIDSLLNISGNITLQGQVEEGFKRLNQVEKLIKNSKTVSTNKIQTWYWQLNFLKSYSFIFQGDFDKALEFGLKSHKISKMLGINFTIVSSFDLLGIIYLSKNDIDKGMLYSNKALKFYEEAKNLNRISASCSNIGQFLYYRGQFNQSLKYLERSLAIKETPDISKISNFTIIGSIFTDKGELKRGLDYLLKGLAIAEKSHFSLQYSLNLLGIGRNLKSQGNFDGAITNFERCLEVAEELGNFLIMDNSIFRLLTIYLEKGDDKKAKWYLNRLKENIKEGEDEYSHPFFLLGKALMLKTSKRISDIGEAEKVLKEFMMMLSSK